MKNVFQLYSKLWPESSLPTLKPILEAVKVARFPSGKDDLRNVDHPRTIAVVKELRLKELMRLVGMGFEHIVQEDREDFAQELLTACFMIAQPDTFFRNPIPFFVNGFKTYKAIDHPDKHLILRFSKPSEKSTLLDWLAVFLDQQPKTNALKDLCIQVADEMVSNVLFNAPTSNKKRLFKDVARTTDLELPTSRRGKLFACFADHKVVIGCVDSYGSLVQKEMVEYLAKMFNETGNEFRPTGGGAGLGMKYIIENSGNFYLLVSPGKFTLMACGFMLRGFQANTNQNKNLHLCFG